MISEQMLLLYFYADGLSDGEYEQIRAALEQDEALRLRYQALSQDLRVLGRVEPVDLPVGTQTRWHQSLKDVIDTPAAQPLLGGLVSRRVAFAAALGLVFIGGLWAGNRLNGTGPLPVQEQVVSTAPQSGPVPDVPRPRAVFVRGVAAHFERTQMQLASMDLTDTRQRRELVESIVSQNRFFLKAANEQGADDVARLLRAFEPLLLSIADDAHQGRSATQIRDQLDFELGATLTKFNRQTSNQAHQF